MVLSETVGGPRSGGGQAEVAGHSGMVSGSLGVTASELYPTGFVIIDGERVEGQIRGWARFQKGEKIRVVDNNGLELIVEPEK